MKKSIELKLQKTVKIKPIRPFAFDPTFHKPDHFTSGDNYWEQKIYSKLFFDSNPGNPVPVKKILMHFEKFGKYKQLAVHYIWEDLFWKRKNERIPWLEKEIRI